MNTLNSSFRSIKNYVIPSEEIKYARYEYIENIRTSVDKYLGTDEKSNIRVLQVVIIAVFDIHDRIYNDSREQKIISDNYVKESPAFQLYARLTEANVYNGNELTWWMNRICTHMIANKAKQIMNIYTPVKTAFTDTSKKLIDSMVEKSYKNAYNLAKNKKLIMNILSEVNGLIKRLVVNGSKLHDANNDLMVQLKFIEKYLTLPIVTKEDIEYFFKKLVDLGQNLQVALKECLNCQKNILKLPDEFTSNTKKAISKDISGMYEIGQNLKKLVDLMQMVMNDEYSVNKSGEFSMELDFSELEFIQCSSDEETADTENQDKIKQHEKQDISLHILQNNLEKEVIQTNLSFSQNNSETNAMY